MPLVTMFNTIYWREGPVPGGGSGGGYSVLPYMGYIGMCGPKGYGSSAVLVIQ